MSVKSDVCGMLFLCRSDARSTLHLYHQHRIAVSFAIIRPSCHLWTCSASGQSSILYQEGCCLSGNCDVHMCQGTELSVSYVATSMHIYTCLSQVACSVSMITSPPTGSQLYTREFDSYHRSEENFRLMCAPSSSTVKSNTKGASFNMQNRIDTLSRCRSGSVICSRGHCGN